MVPVEKREYVKYFSLNIHTLDTQEWKQRVWINVTKKNDDIPFNYQVAPDVNIDKSNNHC